MSSGGSMSPAMARSSGGSMSPAMAWSPSSRRREHRNGGGRFRAEIEMDTGVALPRGPELGFAAAVREPLVRLQRPKYDFERWDWGYFAWPHDRLDANMEMRDSDPRATFEADSKVTESFLSRSILQVEAGEGFPSQSSPQLEASDGGFAIQSTLQLEAGQGFPSQSTLELQTGQCCLCQSRLQLEAGQCFLCQSTPKLESGHGQGFPCQSTLELEAAEGFLISQSWPQPEASDGFPSQSTLQLEAGEGSPSGRSMLPVEFDDDTPLGRYAPWRRGCAESSPFLLDHCMAPHGRWAY
ncbi:uncharacterized protein LOC125511296 [Triticum urartu]|uniref:uncharacterized protein LOC125511275 n=1 Tax=Triticum urartu TaxID=4572 RepID=UPI0020443C01|nr:uncharacterized protein LOC125511275 [Triticum urartu]XP_048532585.1 uncharacterized protein LOC125511296 [Triticum urartu]